MRAQEPEQAGYVERGGVRVGYEVFGSDGPAIIFLPSWQIVHSRQWKLQAPYLARHMRVITYDARGNGRSDRPGEAERYAHREIVADAIAVLDAVGAGQAVFAGTSMGALYGLQAAAWYPERVRGVVAIGSVAPYVAPVEPGASPFYDVGAAGSVAAFCAERGLLGLPRVRRVLHGRGHHRAASHEADRGRRRLGPGDHAGRARAHRRRPGRGDQGSVRGRVPGGALPGAGRARRRGRDHPVRARGGAGRAAGRRARHARGRRSPALARRPGALQPVDPRVRRGAASRGDPAAALEPGAAQGAPPARGVLADRAGARPSRCRDRRRAAHAAPGPRGALAGPAPGHGGAGRARRMRPPGVGAVGRGVRAHRVGGRASTTCTSSRRTGAWTRSCWPTSWSSTTSRPKSTSTSSSPTRVGTSTTSCTRTRSSSAARSRGSPTSSAGCRCPTAERPRSR